MTDMKKSEAGEGVGCNLNLPEKLVLELRPDGGKKASWGYPNDVPAGEAACEYAWGRRAPGAPRMARRPVLLERSEMMGTPGKEKGRESGRIIDGLGSDHRSSTRPLYNVHGSQPGQWTEAEIQLVNFPSRARWVGSASAQTKGCLCLIHIQVLWGPVEAQTFNFHFK